MRRTCLVLSLVETSLNPGGRVGCHFGAVQNRKRRRRFLPPPSTLDVKHLAGCEISWGGVTLLAHLEFDFERNDFVRPWTTDDELNRIEAGLQGHISAK